MKTLDRLRAFCLWKAQPTWDSERWEWSRPVESCTDAKRVDKCALCKTVDEIIVPISLPAGEFPPLMSGDLVIVNEPTLTNADIDQIVEGIEQFIIGEDEDDDIAPLWQPYIDKLNALKR